MDDSGNYRSTLRVACQLREGDDEKGAIVRLSRAAEQMAGRPVRFPQQWLWLGGSACIPVLPAL